MKVYLSFPPSASPDVVGYQLYIQAVPDPVTIESPFVPIGLDTRVCLNEEFPELDGVFNIGVAAVDDAGNLSPLSIKEGVVLDFMAPAIPGPLEITYEA